MRQRAVDLRDAIERGDLEHYGGLIGVAWELERRLYSGACSPVIADIILSVENGVWDVRLAGDCGGGEGDGGRYLYLVPRNASAAQCIRYGLTQNSPNTTVQFVEMGVSQGDIEVKRIRSRRKFLKLFVCARVFSVYTCYSSVWSRLLTTVTAAEAAEAFFYACFCCVIHLLPLWWDSDGFRLMLFSSSLLYFFLASRFLDLAWTLLS
ncbi:fucose kinase [Trypanosoma rangeli]|uniref:Fucose kinase n=1 Tax=Trypanosoma rangeli TaxID=5698 RepID=A0A422N961_TRYRA|nr:fucose kinase [Trypanosoma rangeli]RNF01991.1 fucose kinase [Trypanosoma rangeli]|eukprot:RNF01991.1 fucose kinase [Trypanosoma rangeli]